MTEGDTTPVVIYKSRDGTAVAEVRLTSESVWLRQDQMAALFGVQKAGISKHLKNIFASGELDRSGTVSKMETVQQEGGRRITRQVEYFSLDAIISVGYRVNSASATHFRQWATRVLREHLTRGYTINRQRFETNARELEAALALIRKTAASPELTKESGQGLVDIVSRYAQTFLLLQRYDEGLLTDPVTRAGGRLPTAAEARASLAELKRDLLARREATELFALERDDGLAALLGNLDQTAFGDPVYASVEAKAAHLLYFVVKNHPFTDGNKRSGAFLFIDFLHRNGRLIGSGGEPVINDIGLAALTLLVAESDPKQKDTLIRLVMNMLAGAE